MNNSILIIGAGNMGGALINGLAKSQASEKDLTITVQDRRPAQAKLYEHLNIGFLNNLTDVAGFGGIVLCVKPQDFNSVAAEMKKTLSKETTIMSLMAGVEIADLKKTLDFTGQVVRSMPNIPAKVDAAATAMAACDTCDDKAKALAMTVFGSVGEAVWVKESLLDAVTGLSGSGPAYVYMMIESLTDGGVKMGIPRATAHQLSVQTVLGAAQLVKESGIHPAVLKDQVTTPGGTTIHAIHELEERGLRAMLISAVETATKQSKNLRT
jgi:pyrroline-5-carboxylate reductase